MNIHQTSATDDDTWPRQALISAEASRAIGALETALTDMTVDFFKDFANGRVGRKHNTYEHRTRVLRQMAANLAAARSLALRPQVS